MAEQEKIPAVTLNFKIGRIAKGSAYPMPRVWHRTGRRKRSARFLVKCGCCDESFEIYYGELDDSIGGSLEIAGVNASVEDMRAILLPLLGFERNGDEWSDVRPKK